jgi:hypothetical protein
MKMQQTESFSSEGKIVLLLAAKKYLLEHPERYHQDRMCGSACCIAGTIAWMLIGSHKDSDHVEHVVMQLLGSRTQVEIADIWLFRGVHEWPTQFRNAYEIADSPEERAAVGALAIDRYIEELRSTMVEDLYPLQLVAAE